MKKESEKIFCGDLDLSTRIILQSIGGKHYLTPREQLRGSWVEITSAFTSDELETLALAPDLMPFDDLDVVLSTKEEIEPGEELKIDNIIIKWRDIDITSVFESDMDYISYVFTEAYRKSIA